MQEIKDNSFWVDSKSKGFRVVKTVFVEGHTWVHYREEPPRGESTKNCKEYNCIAEAFVERFFERAE